MIAETMADNKQNKRTRQTETATPILCSNRFESLNDDESDMETENEGVNEDTKISSKRQMDKSKAKNQPH